MTNIIEFDIPTNIVMILQKLQLEVQSRQGVIAFMINHNLIDNQESFQYYENLYQQSYQEYEKTKMNFQLTYVNPILEEQHISLENAAWFIDFNTQKAQIIIKNA